MSIRDEKYVYGQFFNFWGKNVIFDFYWGKSINCKNYSTETLDEWEFYLSYEYMRQVYGENLETNGWNFKNGPMGKWHVAFF